VPGGLSEFQTGALLAGLTFIAVNYVAAKETGSVQVVIVTILVGILTVFSILGVLQADIATLRPFFPAETGGAAAVLPTTGLVFVSLLGFAKTTTVAEELRNPGRNLPLAVVGSVLTVTVMYATITVVPMGVVDRRQLGPEFTTTPVLDVADVAFGTIGIAGTGVGLLTFAGLLATASGANASILASSRINSTDRRLPRLLRDPARRPLPRGRLVHRGRLPRGAGRPRARDRTGGVRPPRPPRQHGRRRRPRDGGEPRPDDGRPAQVGTVQGTGAPVSVREWLLGGVVGRSYVPATGDRDPAERDD
jgi:hypothetical protein